MTARELVDFVYFLCVENREPDDVEKLNGQLKDPDESGGPQSQEDRRAAILAMGGVVA